MLVYKTMDAFSGMDKVLLIKKESDPFAEVIESVADYAGKLAEQLRSATSMTTRSTSRANRCPR
ncbi:MAG: hypothetical protein WCE62_18755 [Polyangiales bacterium]